MKDEVVILLATYNGEKYVSEMIESIIKQTHKNWKLYLSDDSSTDNTVALLKYYAEREPERVFFYSSGRKFGNAQSHFMHLLDHFSNERYIMFCDQDDYWHTQKIEMTLNKIKEIEEEGRVPALVHTDLRVVDKNLNRIDDSFMHYSKINGNGQTLNRRLVQNVVTGCTIMLNNSLSKIVCKNIPEKGMAMHDWWIAILAEIYGKVGYIDTPTIDYRQHNNNQVGAKNVVSLDYIKRKIKSNTFKREMCGTYNQAEMILECFGKEMPSSSKKTIEKYCETKNKGWIARRISWIKYGYLKSGILRVIAQFIFC